MSRAVSRVAAAALALLSLACGPAWSAETVDADWVRKPSGEEFAHAFPPMANALGVEGRVIIACAITVNGVLTECVAESETPKGLGFAKAALSMTPAFRMRPTTVGGRARGGDNIRIPISFRLPPAPPGFDPGPPTSQGAVEIARRLVAAQGMRDRLMTAYGASADTASWRRWEVDDATVAAGMVAQQKALEIVAPAWLEAAARGDAALFTEAQLTAAVAYSESQVGQTAWRKSESFDALTAPLTWVTFRRSLSLGRGVFCQTHNCTRLGGGSDNNGRETTILTPDWLETPTRGQVRRATPFLASALSVPGQAQLRCSVTTLGLLYDCGVLSQAPEGLGFGAAAIELAKFYRAQPLPPGATAAPPTVALAILFPEIPAFPPPFAPLPVLDSNPGAARLELARQIISAIDLRTELAAISVKSMAEFDAIPSPGVDARTRAEVRAALAAGVDQGIGFFEAERAKQYAGLFTEAELRGLLDWELSPAGKATRAAQARQSELVTAMDKSFAAETSRRAGLIFCASRGCTTKIGQPPTP